jgi:hypothetical protein
MGPPAWAPAAFRADFRFKHRIQHTNVFGGRHHAMSTVIRELFSGEILYRQGDPSDCAWLVERGAIELNSEQGRRTIHHGSSVRAN